MPTTETDLANGALALLGVDPIGTLADPVPRARVLKARYPLDRRALLELLPWRFATVRQSLPESAPAPAHRFAHAYALPADAVDIVQVGDGVTERGLVWAQEGRRIVTDESAPLPVVLTLDVTDSSQFSDGFVDALSAKLAASAAYALTRSTSARDAMLVLFERALARAAHRDALRGTPERWLGADDLTAVR